MNGFKVGDKVIFTEYYKSTREHSTIIGVHGLNGHIGNPSYPYTLESGTQAEENELEIDKSAIIKQILDKV